MRGFGGSTPIVPRGERMRRAGAMKIVVGGALRRRAPRQPSPKQQSPKLIRARGARRSLSSRHDPRNSAKSASSAIHPVVVDAGPRHCRRCRPEAVSLMPTRGRRVASSAREPCPAPLARVSPPGRGYTPSDDPSCPPPSDSAARSPNTAGSATSRRRRSLRATTSRRPGVEARRSASSCRSTRPATCTTISGSSSTGR